MLSKLLIICIYLQSLIVFFIRQQCCGQSAGADPADGHDQPTTAPSRAAAPRHGEERSPGQALHAKPLTVNGALLLLLLLISGQLTIHSLSDKTYR